MARNEKEGIWDLTVETNGTKTTRQFDKVIMTNGLVYKPAIPHFEGQDQFQGTIIHGRDYKS